MPCKLYFSGDESELKKMEAYFTKIKALTMKNSTQNMTSSSTSSNSTVVVPHENDSVVVGELKLAHRHSDMAV